MERRGERVNAENYSGVRLGYLDLNDIRRNFCSKAQVETRACQISKRLPTFSLAIDF